MSITVTRKPGVNRYTLETYNGRMTVGTYSKMRGAVASLGWMTFMLNRDEFAETLRSARKFKRKGWGA